ncbi:MAG: hypothetical protein HRT38_16280 [Alteromonadaceae bacterium]|nr:hypothetical protein [Alteromonadaceae bacterium]
MNSNETIQLIDNLEAQLDQLRKNVLTSKVDKNSFIQLNDIGKLVTRYCKEHNNQLGDFSLLANISANTLTRALRAPETSKIETINSVLKVIGKQLYIGDKQTSNIQISSNK